MSTAHGSLGSSSTACHGALPLARLLPVHNCSGQMNPGCRWLRTSSHPILLRNTNTCFPSKQTGWVYSVRRHGKTIYLHEHVSGIVTVFSWDGLVMMWPMRNFCILSSSLCYLKTFFYGQGCIFITSYPGCCSAELSLLLASQMCTSERAVWNLDRNTVWRGSTEIIKWKAASDINLGVDNWDPLTVKQFLAIHLSCPFPAAGSRFQASLQIHIKHVTCS